MIKRKPNASWGWMIAGGAVLSTLVLSVVRTAPGPPLPTRVLVVVAAALMINGAIGLRSTNTQLLWHVSRFWGLLLGLALAFRMLFDTFVPTTNYQPRATVLSIAAITTLIAAGFCGAWRSGHVRTGALAAITASVIGSGISLVALAVLAAFSLETNDPGGPADAFGVALRLLAIGSVVGTIGGMLGRGLGGIAEKRPT